MPTSVGKIAIRYFGTDSIPPKSSWASLPDELRVRGFELVRPDAQPAPDFSIDIDFVSKSIAHQAVARQRRFLIATEPITVKPKQYSKRVSRQFRRVFVSPQSAIRQKNFKAWSGGYWNPDRHSKVHANDGKRRGVAFVNENKFSLVKHSNYILRTKVILQSLECDRDLEFAGRNWSRGVLWTLSKLAHHFVLALPALNEGLKPLENLTALKLPLKWGSVQARYGGEVPDAGSYLSDFKVAIVIENESSYVSEKLYIALLAGCQCVYVGPKLPDGDFPPGFLFQAEANSASVFMKVDEATRTPYEATEPELTSFVRSGEFFNRESAIRRNASIADVILEDANLFGMPQSS